MKKFGPDSEVIKAQKIVAARRQERRPLWPRFLLLFLVLSLGSFIMVSYLAPSLLGSLADVLPWRQKKAELVVIPATELETAAPETEVAATEVEPTETLPPQSLEILVTGDILLHEPILNEALATSETGDFSFLFKGMRTHLERADLAIGDMEGTLSAAPPYSGYPTFVAPDQAAADLRAAGFDILYTANNHSLDGGLEGLIHTVQALREQGLEVVGTRAAVEERPYLVKEVQGLKLALSSWTYETDRQGDQLQFKTLNGIVLPEEGESLIDSFSVQEAFPDVLATDEAALRERVRAMKAEKPDLILFFMHWGEEYSATANARQEHLAQILADEGVDVVLGCHPHVVQPLKIVSASEGEHRMICLYSLGNFVSNQQPDSGNSEGRAEDGVACRLRLEKRPDGSTELAAFELIPLYMYKTYPNFPTENRTRGWVLPVREALADPEAYEAAELKEVLEASLGRTEKVLAESDELKLPWLLRAEGSAEATSAATSETTAGITGETTTETTGASSGD